MARGKRSFLAINADETEMMFGGEEGIHYVIMPTPKQAVDKYVKDFNPSENLDPDSTSCEVHVYELVPEGRYVIEEQKKIVTTKLGDKP